MDKGMHTKNIENPINLSMNEQGNASNGTLFELHEPIVFKNILCTTEGSNGWKLLEWSLDDFANKCGDLKLPFRVGKNIRTEHPQWEVETPLEDLTVKQFLTDSIQKNDESKWFYCDYKHMSQWFKEKPEIVESFDWKLFNLDLDGSDSTIWVGSKGAHTNCHQDTYGCNLVAQVHGRKLWLLFSPKCSDAMQPTRIPYEESTIYSKYNFFTPSKQEIEAIKSMQGHVKMVVLEPKDVLFVPKGWWHYVESLETSLSVNVWIPLEEDCKARLKETLVKLVVSTIGEGIVESNNESESDLSECIQLLKTSIQECKLFEEETEQSSKTKKLKLGHTTSLESMKTKIKKVPDITLENISDFIHKNVIPVDNDEDLKETHNENDSPTGLKLLQAVIDAFCTDEVTEKVSRILTDKFAKTKSKI